MSHAMLILWTASCGLALVGFAIFWDAVWRLGVHRDWKHHAYYGLPFIVQPWWWWLWPFGLYVLLDDAYQHRRQLYEPLYLSPLHRLYERVYRLVVR